MENAQNIEKFKYEIFTNGLQQPKYFDSIEPFIEAINAIPEPTPPVEEDAQPDAGSLAALRSEMLLMISANREQILEMKAQIEHLLANQK